MYIYISNIILYIFSCFIFILILLTALYAKNLLHLAIKKISYHSNIWKYIRNCLAIILYKLNKGKFFFEMPI